MGKHRNGSSFLVLWHNLFSDGRKDVNVILGEGRPSFRNCGAVKNEGRDVIDADQRLRVPKVAEKRRVLK